MVSVFDVVRPDRIGTDTIRCAIYTRKSHEEGLDQAFNSLDAQRESAEAYIASQRLQGWRALPDRYDDGGFSGSNLDRPGIQRLLADVDAGKVDVIVVYKIDRLSRSLLDFMKMIETFNRKNVSFVSVTQHFNTTDPTGRMFLGILITFAQYEREVIAERIRDKIAATKKRGMYCGGPAILGYDVDRQKKELRVDQEEALLVKNIFRRFSHLGSARAMAAELNGQGHRTKSWTTLKGKHRPGNEWNTSQIYRLLNNLTYIGIVAHKGNEYQGKHEAIITRKLWDSVHDILTENTQDKQSRARTKSISILHGVVRCGHCNCAMGPTYTQKGTRRYTYYHCAKDAKRAVSQCRLKRVPAGEIERIVLEHVKSVLQTPELLSPAYLSTVEIQRLQVRLQVNGNALPESNLQSLDTMRPANGSEPRPDQSIPGDPQTGLSCPPDEETIATSGTAVLDTFSEAERKVMDTLQDLGHLWKYLLPLERNRLVRLLVEKVEIRDSGVDMVIRTQDLPHLSIELAEIAGEARIRSVQV